MSTININREEAHKAYAALSAEERAAVEKVVPRRFLIPEDIMERVRTFNEACEEIGKDHEYVRTYAATVLAIKERLDMQDVLSYLRLRVIVCALNDGWDSRDDMYETGFGPHYILLDKEEYEQLSAFDKAMCVELWTDVDGVPLHAKIGVCKLCCGNALALRTPELARYAGFQFAREYKCLLFRIQGF